MPGCILIVLAFPLALGTVSLFNIQSYSGIYTLFVAFPLAAIMVGLLIYKASRDAELKSRTTNWMREQTRRHEEMAGDLTSRAAQAMDSLHSGLHSLRVSYSKPKGCSTKPTMSFAKELTHHFGTTSNKQP